jgi:predicted phage terminase large subunit-like protein
MKVMDPLIKALLRKQFLPFARKSLRELEGVKLDNDPYLKYLAHEFDQFANRNTRRLIINLPPGHLKTSLGSVCLPAWMLAHDPSLKIIVISHAEHLSKSIARKNRSIMRSAWYKELFPTRIMDGHAEVTDFGTTSGGGVFATSFHASFTGRRADVTIVDDPHDISDSFEQIEATVQSYNSDLRSRLNKGGRELVIAHRVHECDLSAHLMQKEGWNHVVLPLIAIADQTYKTSAGLWHRCKGEMLRPGSLSAQDLNDLRASLVNPDFGMLYQQDIESQSLPTITGAHFPSFSEPLPLAGPIVLSVDAGISNRRHSAYSVVQVWCLMQNCYLLLDQFREQTDFAGLRDQLRFFRKRYRPVAILIEQAANGPALISDLSRKFSHLIRAIDPGGRSKSARLLTHAAKILSRRIYLPALAPWREEFVREFCEFPKGKFTDQVDAATQLLDHASEYAGLTSFASGERAIAATASGRYVKFAPAQGGECGLVGVARYGRPSGSLQGPIISIKTEVQY